MEACDETLRTIKVAGAEPPPTPHAGRGGALAGRKGQVTGLSLWAQYGEQACKSGKLWKATSLPREAFGARRLPQESRRRGAS